MRISEEERKTIVSIAKSVFDSNVLVYLFGSRADDSKRGGDIDLYIKTNGTKNLFKKKIKFLVELENRIGEQKVDVVVNSDSNRLIEQIAISEGIKL